MDVIGPRWDGGLGLDEDGLNLDEGRAGLEEDGLYLGVVLDIEDGLKREDGPG